MLAALSVPAVLSGFGLFVVLAALRLFRTLSGLSAFVVFAGLLATHARGERDQQSDTDQK